MSDIILPTVIHLLVHGSNFPDIDHHMTGGKSGCYFTIKDKDFELVKSPVVIHTIAPVWESIEIDVSGIQNTVEFDVEVFCDEDKIGFMKLTLGDLILADGKLTSQLNTKYGVTGSPKLTFEVAHSEKADVNAYRALNNAFLFSFPEHVNDLDEEAHIADFVHDMEKTCKLGDDQMWRLDGITDKVKGFMESMWNSLIHSQKIGFPVYRQSVYHDRQDPFVSQFMGHNLVLRMELGLEETENLVTDVGNIVCEDHLLFSVKDVNDNFADKAGFEAEHVELIAAPRFRGFRFAPISLYFVYRHKDDVEPAYHLVESGTGVSNNTGLIYWGGEFDVETASELGFKPTPYTSKYNYYHHTTSRDGKDPTNVVIRSFQPGKDHPYITVGIEYTRIDNPDDPNHTISNEDMISPLGSTMVALERMYTIADGFGCVHPMDYPGIELAKAGRCQEWITQPPVHLAPKPEDNPDESKCQLL